MNQIERLLRRAVAVPRGAGRDDFDGFDPFEQTAAWPVDAASSSSVARSSSSAGGAPIGDSAAPITPPARSAAATDAPVVSSEPAMVAVQVPEAATPWSSIGPASATAANTIEPTAPEVPREPASVIAPLAQADAFMQALRAGTAAADPARPTLRARESTASPDAAVVVARGPNDTPPATTPIRPVTPPALPPTDEPIVRSGRTAKPAPPAVDREPVGGTPAHTRTPPERVIETTVVVASSSSRRLDELAHGSRIARFGIGQG